MTGFEEMQLIPDFDSNKQSQEDNPLLVPISSQSQPSSVSKLDAASKHQQETKPQQSSASVPKTQFDKIEERVTKLVDSKQKDNDKKYYEKCAINTKHALKAVKEAITLYKLAQKDEQDDSDSEIIEEDHNTEIQYKIQNQPQLHFHINKNKTITTTTIGSPW